MYIRGIYDRNYNPKDVDTVASKLTHVLYSFADMKEDGEVFNTVSYLKYTPVDIVDTTNEKSL
jgi:GH18 family chitinase